MTCSQVEGYTLANYKQALKAVNEVCHDDLREAVFAYPQYPSNVCNTVFRLDSYDLYYRIELGLLHEGYDRMTLHVVHTVK